MIECRFCDFHLDSEDLFDSPKLEVDVMLKLSSDELVPLGLLVMCVHLQARACPASLAKCACSRQPR